MYHISARLSLTLLMLISHLSYLHAQSCETNVVPEGYTDFISQRFPSPYLALKSGASGAYLLNLIIVTDGTGRSFNRLSYPYIVEAVQKANSYLAPSGISVALCGSPIYVDDSVLYHTVGLSTLFLDFASQMDKEGMINIYVKPTVGSSAYAYYPGAFNRMAFSSMTPKIMAHELGHFFGLIHTFGGSNWGAITTELVNGSNCLTAGDLICDTPADPYPNTLVTTACQYAGTAVDTNGDAYLPDFQNLMSYSPLKCSQHFSIGQNDRMNDIASMERHYLRRDPNPFQITKFPLDMCLGDSISYLLEGSDPNGIFSGPGISNNTLTPSLLSPGTYSCTYVGTAPLGDSVLMVDALQSAHAYSFGIDTVDIWQAFTAKSNRSLEQISFRLANANTTTLSLTIYQGIGTGGTLLHTQSETVASDSLQRWIDFPLNTSIAQTAGQSYTVSLGSSQNMITWSFADSISTTPQLPSSISASNFYGEYFCFATWTKEREGICADTVNFTFNIVDPLASIPNVLGYQFEVENPFCKDHPDLDFRELLNYFDYWSSDTSYFTVNGISDNLLRPDQLGPGSHEVSYQYTSYEGCPAFVVDTIEVLDYPEILLPDTVCLESNPLLLKNIQPEAAFFWGGIEDSIFDPQAVGVGTHDISVHIPNPLDTIYFLASERIFANSSALQVPISQHYGQSLVSDSTARVDTLIWPISVNYSSFWTGPTVAFHLREGAGLNGNLLFADTLKIDSQAYQILKLNAYPHNIEFQKDSAYTMEVVRIDSQFSPSIRLFRFNTTVDIDPDGVAFINSMPDSTIDIDLRVQLRSVLGCGEEQVHQIYVQEVLVDSITGAPNALLGQISSYSLPPQAGISYQWTISNGQILSGQGTDSITVMWASLGAQVVSVLGTSSQGCESNGQSLSVDVLQSTKLEELRPTLNWRIFPNPSRESVNIQFSVPTQSHPSISLVDGVGHVIRKQKVKSLPDQPVTITWDIADLANGMYQVVLQTDQSIYSEKLLILDN